MTLNYEKLYKSLNNSSRKKGKSLDLLVAASFKKYAIISVFKQANDAAVVNLPFQLINTFS